MKIALVGYGVENQATYRFYKKQPNIEVTICDLKTDIDISEGVAAQLGENYLDNLDRFDLIVRTVGMHPAVIIEKNPTVTNKITTAVNLFFETCTTPIIGVTGTKGKGTTSTLVAKILDAGGKKVVLAGNIGTPMLDMLDKAKLADYVVLELSSFQLYDLKHSPGTAVCLMVVPEHLNWHADMVDYKNAKKNLFRFQRQGDRTIYNSRSKTSTEIASISPADTKLVYAVGDPATELADSFVSQDTIMYRDTPICKTNEVGLIGQHNIENVCAAVATTFDLIDNNVDAIRTVVKSFKGLPHRLEFVREINGVKYFDDSFSTTPETAIAALRSFSGPKVLILGGSSKESSYEMLAQAIAKNDIRHIILIGNTSNPKHVSATPEIVRSLSKLGINNFTSLVKPGGTTMHEIVQLAKTIAMPGDIVLLSTAAASFDMFYDYKDRATQFQAAVKALK